MNTLRYPSTRRCTGGSAGLTAVFLRNGGIRGGRSKPDVEADGRHHGAGSGLRARSAAALRDGAAATDAVRRDVAMSARASVTKPDRHFWVVGCRRYKLFAKMPPHRSLL